jgi:hypothetical protein
MKRPELLDHRLRVWFPGDDQVRCAQQAARQ